MLLTLPLALSAFYLAYGRFAEGALTLTVGVGLYWMFRHVSKRRVPRRVDYALTTAIFHMYGLSMGETSPEDLVKTVAENKEYGHYSRVFARIHNLARDLGYGVTRATTHMAESVKPPLKDVLVRLTSVFSSLML